jgi:hypothetical protein
MQAVKLSCQRARHFCSVRLVYPETGEWALETIGSGTTQKKGQAGANVRMVRASDTDAYTGSRIAPCLI